MGSVRFDPCYEINETFQTIYANESRDSMQPIKLHIISKIDINIDDHSDSPKNTYD